MAGASRYRASPRDARRRANSQPAAKPIRPHPTITTISDVWLVVTIQWIVTVWLLTAANRTISAPSTTAVIVL
jgi:hypothetical protein